MNKNNKSMFCQIITICFLFFLIASCQQGQSTAIQGHRPVYESTPDLDIESHQETITDLNNYTYSFDIKSALYEKNTYNRKRPDLPGVQINRSLKIENTGETVVINPHISVNGKKNWESIDTILKEVISPDMTEREKAYALWNFVLVNHYHFTPAEAGDELHDPVRFFNIYGYGICDDSARNLVVLWNAAGLEARLWALNGHVVSEVFYDGQYHLFDADMKVFYLLGDNETVASSDQIRQNPELASRTHHEGPFSAADSAKDQAIAGLYGADDTVMDFDFVSEYRMDYELRPAETMEWRWDNTGKYHEFYQQDSSNEPPPYFANGKLIYTPDLGNNLFRQFLVQEKNISTDPVDGKSPILHADDPKKDSHIVVNFKSPYVMVGGRIVADLIRSSTKDVIKIYISPDNVSWQRLWMAENQTGFFSQEISLDDWLDTHSTLSKHEYYVMVEFIPHESVNGAGASRLTFETDLQMSPFSLPALEPGTNHIQYTDNTNGPHQVVITHQWKQYNDNIPPAPPQEPIFPADGQIIDATQPIFSWHPASDSNGDSIQAYQFILGDQPEIKYPLSPNFNMMVNSESFNTPFSSLLNHKTKYYWKVRSLDSRGAWSPWSKVWSFQTD